MDRSRVVGALAAATGGCAALLSLTTARQFVGRDASLGDLVVHAPETAAALGIVVAIVAATLTVGRGLVVPAAVSAIGLLGVALSVGSAMQTAPAAIGTATAAGLAIGGLVGWATAVGTTGALATGAVVGATVSVPLRHPFDLLLDRPAPEYTVDTRSVGLALAVIALVCLVGAGVARRTTPTPSSPPPHPSGVVICLGITVVAWALGLWFESAQPIKGWYWGWLLVPSVVAGAVALRARGGATVLVVALAWSVIHSVDLSWLPDVDWLAVLVPLAAVGVVVGRRIARPEILLLVLVPCAATWLITGGPMSRTFSVVALFVVPVVVIAALTSEVRRTPVSPGVLATALTAVALWETSPRAVVFEVFSFSVGNQTGSYAVNPYAVHGVTLAAEYVVPAVVALAVCAVALLQLRRKARDA